MCALDHQCKGISNLNGIKLNPNVSKCIIFDYILQNYKNKDIKFKTPSNYIPPPNSYPPELDELHILLKQELRKLPGNVRIKDNLTKADRLALKELSNISDLVIKKADKGSNIEVM